MLRAVLRTITGGLGMLMVVFGAGASFDSVPAYPARAHGSMEDRLPLANQLFENRSLFADVMSRFPKVRPIIPYLQAYETGITIERVLQELQDEAAEYPERHKQLAAVRYYLHVMLWECEMRWRTRIPGGATNQITLLDQIERWRKRYGQVCLVTFNYDRMLESALSTVDVKIQSLPDYIANDDYKLIKLHGSVDWGRRIESPVEFRPDENLWEIAHRFIERADQIEVTQSYEVVEVTPMGSNNGVPLFPALAIPVETKADYECPQEHLDALLAAIPQVDKLMVIGWRAAETPFLQLLGDHLPGPVWGLVAAENRDAASETADRLRNAGAVGDYTLMEGGFTDLVVNRQADDFLRR